MNNQKWQLIETAPKSGVWLLGFGDGPATERCIYVMEWYHDGWIEIYSGDNMQPTNWMPLPEAPTT